MTMRMENLLLAMELIKFNNKLVLYMKSIFSMFFILIAIVGISQNPSKNKKREKTIRKIQKQLTYFETSLICETCENGEWIRNYKIFNDKLECTTNSTLTEYDLNQLIKVTESYEGIKLEFSNFKTTLISYINEIVLNAEENTEDYGYGLHETKEAKKLLYNFKNLLQANKNR